MQGAIAPPRGSRSKRAGSSSALELSLHFEGLAHPTRLTILERLAVAAEMRVSELAELCKVSQPRMSWHLRQLRRSQLIRTRRDGREVFCRLDRESIATNLRNFVRLLHGGAGPTDEAQIVKEFIEVVS